jgi:hypothetical protein
MKRGLLILLLGLLVGAGASYAVFRISIASHRAMLKESAPELTWLKNEFNLSDAEFTRISELHSAYLTQCHQRCQVIEAQNEKLQQLLATNKAVTPEIESLLAERARTRAECEAAMLKHFIAVSRAMPPAEGERYLAWVEEQTLGRGDGMEQRHHQ